MINNKLQINKFNLWNLGKKGDNTKYTPKIVIIAKWGWGKSWVIKNIMNFFKDIPCGIVICPTECVNNFYSWFVWKTHIYDKYDKWIIEKIFERQKNMMKKNLIRASQNKPPIDHRIFLIMDDCMADNAWTKDKSILE